MNAANQTKKGADSGVTAARAGQKDLVFGLGATGLSVARYLKRCGRPARYVDSRVTPPGLEELRGIDSHADIVLGTANKNVLQEVGRIIVSPGVANSEPLLKKARDAGIEIISDIELFVRSAKAPFVAITGSNGKSTVTTLVSLMCSAAGKKVLSGANLGRPALDLLADETPDLYVLELSSFQLIRTKDLPAKVAVLLNITADHLDWHGSEAEYRAAKHRIFRQAKSAVFNRAQPDAESHVPDPVPRVSFGLDEPQAGNYGLVAEEGEQFLARGAQLLLSTSDMVLVGAHNYANALAAVAVGHLIGLQNSPMLQVLTEFPGLPHRMQFVANVAGVQFINDSKATNVGAAIASVKSVAGPVILIAGGDGKGGDFQELAQAVAEDLRAAVLLGRDGPRIAAAFKGLVPVYQAADMKTAVSVAASIAEEADTVLLAPACASFDQYANYAERGSDFCGAVEAIAG
ncbi:MAG: UDP-N-acetylmuramoyl-L-alanine--D-glutamate ligase [Woeseia sp.]